jgi:hypothetical protein
MQSLRQTDPISYALSFINTEKTKYQYRQQLRFFFESEYLGFAPAGANLEVKAQAFLDRARGDQAWAQEVIIAFLDHNKKRVNAKEISSGTLKAYSKPIKLFCDMNDVTSINWKRILRSLPKVRNVANDRPYTTAEIQNLIKYTDRRTKTVVLVMCSSGFRLAAWDWLKWGHVSPIEQNGQIVAAKLRVYADDPEEYYSFISPEAYDALKDWMDYRAANGEQITASSWVMRDIRRTSDVKLEIAGGGFGLATCPKKIQNLTVKRLLERALEKQGVREKKKKPPLGVGVGVGGATRYDVKVSHGLRKFADTRLHEVMDDTKVKILMGQSTGISDHYNKPDENKLLAEYLKAVHSLTISEVSQNVGNDTLQQKETETQLQEMQKQINVLFEALQSSQVIKQVDEEQKQMLIESKEYRQATKEALQQEQDQIEGALQEGLTEGEEMLY